MMTDHQFAALAEMMTAQVHLLGEIRDLLAHGILAAEDETEGCAHPDEARVSLATVTQPDHWICRQCRYEHTGLTPN